MASGSDCGHIFIWSSVDGRLVKLLRGDSIGAVLSKMPSSRRLIAVHLGELPVWSP